MAVRRLLALVGVGLILIGTLAAAVAVSGPSPRVSVARTGAGIPLRTRAGGRGEAPVDSTGPFVADTLVLLNNTLVPGNFLAANGVGPRAIAYDSGKGEVFVANQFSGIVSVISDVTNAVVTAIPVGSGPAGVAYDSAKGEVFVTNSNSNTVSVISDATNAVVASVPVMGSSPVGVAYDNGTGELFVTNQGSSTVTVVSDITNAVVAVLGGFSAPVGIAYDSVRGEVFVANQGSNNVSVYNDGTDSFVRYRWVTDNAVGSGPGGVTFEASRGEEF